MKNLTFHRRKIVTFVAICQLVLLLLIGRLFYLMIYQSEYYTTKATDLHQRERSIKAKRGRIIDATGVVLADNKTVCNISVIYNQMTDKEKVIEILSKELNLSQEYIENRVYKVSSIERIKSNVSKEIGDIIRAYDLPGVKVDEDYKRYYPFDDLASKVLGFTGGDNQGIIGLEVKYEEYLQGTPGTILTLTDAKGVELLTGGEERIEPVAGEDLYISLDINVQKYATQLAEQTLETKEADGVSILVMNVKNGEIMAMVNVPEFNLNEPYELTDVNQVVTEENKQELLNQMWRNPAISDTYEPGSTFKIITAAAGLEEGVVEETDSFSCPGYIIVEDRKIKCHKTNGHGSETFLEGTMNSCNPVFVSVGMRLGIETYYDYFKRFGLLEKTGIDLPGEAGTIMHNVDNMGLVELATVSFGQSFQITPIKLLETVASIVNGGVSVTPHLAVKSVGNDMETVFSYETTSGLVTQETSDTMKHLLEEVVTNGTGKNGYVEGFLVGGKTATSQTLPRGSGKYIASFVGFAPADDPEVIALAVIHNPQGTYYGGQIAAPLVRQLFENILPYLEGM
ncbi:MAG: peptidoglycan D,D-transpeptidase FtsI family protein [Lachnospiraceae bacterium]